jgi:hypothetical protein
MRWKKFGVVVILALGIASCGGDGGETGPGASGLEKSKTWSALTPAERAMLCDWEATKAGGYGTSVDCGNGTSISAYPSQQACVDNFPATCGARVADFEACARDSSCATGIFAPSCAPLAACLQ